MHLQRIRPSSSPNASLICPIRKKDGSLRLCVNYRRLNSMTRQDAFPTSNLNECLDSLVGAKYFSTLDLKHGYLQVPVKKRTSHKTAVRAPGGLWKFKRMPFGPKRAPAACCRLINLALGHLKLTQVLFTWMTSAPSQTLLTNT